MESSLEIGYNAMRHMQGSELSLLLLRIMMCLLQEDTRATCPNYGESTHLVRCLSTAQKKNTPKSDLKGIRGL